MRKGLRHLSDTAPLGYYGIGDFLPLACPRPNFVNDVRLLHQHLLAVYYIYARSK